MLLRAVAGVFSARVLMLALLGVVIAEAGVWALCGSRVSDGNSLAYSPTGVTKLGSGVLVVDPPNLVREAWNGQFDFWQGFIAPFWIATDSAAMEARQVLAGVWRIAVWSLLGVAIARIAAMHLTHHDRPAMTTALRRSLRNGLGQVAGPLVVLALVGAMAAAIWLLGWLSQVSFIGVLFTLVWPLVFVFALLVGLLAFGLAVGWPLMVASQAVERPDPYDAVSCGFAYVYQRPVRLVAYVVQAAIVGALVGGLVLLALQLGTWFLIPWFVAAGEPTGAQSSLIRFWTAALAYVPVVFHAAYFWFAAVPIYLLLRRDIDEKQADEVFLDDQPLPTPDVTLAENEPVQSESGEPAPDASEEVESA